jgi:arsenate reductase
MGDDQELKKRVLFVCTGNSCRSQMAEGLWRAIAGVKWDVHSAGSEPAGFVHPLAIEVMREIGIDMADHFSKHMNGFFGQPFDLIVTVCDNAQTACPSFPGSAKRLHWPFTDPAHATGDGVSRKVAFRKVRDQIADRISAFLRGSYWRP